jgi:hypothetical protein
MNVNDEVRRPMSGEGGLTGATGDLTPDEHDGEFVPAERRAIEDPAAAQAVSVGARERAATHGDPEDVPGSLIGQDEIAPNDRDGGYGSRRGLGADDPAYRMEERHDPAAVPTGPNPAERGPRLGGDEESPPERY